MNANRSSNRCSFPISCLLLLIALSGSGAIAAEVPLRGFTASYDLYQGGMHIATARLSLEPSGEAWRYVMSSRARGVYAWFIDKKPRTETHFRLADDQVQLQQIIVSDNADGRPRESATFDWNKREIDVMRKKKRKRVPFSDSVYDYQSIHLLAASMRQRQEQTATVDFYRKGSLVKSRLVYTGDGTVAVDGRNRGAKIFDQLLGRSQSKVRYYYDVDNPLLPLRIEKLESGESPAVMTLRDVEWAL